MQHCVSIRPQRRRHHRHERRRDFVLCLCRIGGRLDGRPQPVPLAVLVVRRPQLDLQQPPPERLLLLHLGGVRRLIQPGMIRQALLICFNELLIIHKFAMLRVGLKSGPFLLSNTQTEKGRNSRNLGPTFWPISVKGKVPRCNSVSRLM